MATVLVALTGSGYFVGYRRGHATGGAEEHARASGDVYWAWDGVEAHTHDAPQAVTYVRCADGSTFATLPEGR